MMVRSRDEKAARKAAKEAGIRARQQATADMYAERRSMARENPVAEAMMLACIASIEKRAQAYRDHLRGSGRVEAAGEPPGNLAEARVGEEGVQGE